jgi:hypothetical protein
MYPVGWFILLQHEIQTQQSDGMYVLSTWPLQLEATNLTVQPCMCGGLLRAKGQCFYMAYACVDI